MCGLLCVCVHGSSVCVQCVSACVCVRVSGFVPVEACVGILSPAVGSACLFPFSFRFSFVCEKFLFYGVYACTYSSWPFDLSRPRWETAFNARARNNNTNSPTLYFSFRSSLLGQNMHYCFNIPSRFKQLWTTMSLTVL